MFNINFNIIALNSSINEYTSPEMCSRETWYQIGSKPFFYSNVITKRCVTEMRYDPSDCNSKASHQTSKMIDDEQFKLN